MNVIITGANRGIGLELTKRFCEQKASVFALCRHSSSELNHLKSIGVKVFEGVDVTKSETLKQVSKELSGVELDVLVCNAGILKDESMKTMDSIDADSCLEQFNVNALGPLRTFAAFRPHLKKAAKVMMITSRMGSITDNSSGGHVGYRMSKCALNIATISLKHEFQSDGFVFGLFHPGWVQTEMTGKTGHLTPEESSRLLIKRLSELNAQTSGSFWHPEGEILPW
jgi:NAD(P)-dependent dehydrogenase (short-subunit alcohol dehydrogenase family)